MSLNLEVPVSAPTTDRSSSKAGFGGRRARGVRQNGSEPQEGSPDVVAPQRQLFPMSTPGRVPAGAVIAITKDGLGVDLSRNPYDPRVVGVAAGHPTPDDAPDAVYAIISGQSDLLVCLDGGPIATGDLLVASSHPGVAMRARDRYRAIGAIVGKALEPLAWADQAQERTIRALVIL